MELDPKPLSGSWNEGWALDRQVLNSDFLGYGPFGHAQFDTTRTELGELVYRLKYRGDKSCLGPIAAAACGFIRGRGWAIDVIVPVPPSTNRSSQPVVEIAEALGLVTGLPVDSTSLRKERATPAVKNLAPERRREVVAGAHAVAAGAFRGRRVLLLDDLYQSGATLNAVAGLMKDPGGASAVIALALTRAKSYA